MKNKETVFIWSPLDSSHPYRVCAPEFTLGIQRFDNLPQAQKYLEEMNNRGHQAILSFVDVESSTYQIKGYVKGSRYKRKE